MYIHIYIVVYHVFIYSEMVYIYIRLFRNMLNETVYVKETGTQMEFEVQEIHWGYCL